MKALSALLKGTDLGALEKLTLWLAAATPAANDFRTKRLDSVFATSDYPLILIIGDPSLVSDLSRFHYPIAQKRQMCRDGRFFLRGLVA